MATTLQFVQESTVDQPVEQASFRNVAKFFFAVFWTILFTGAIRKWIFPGVSALYLTQDIPILMAYAYAVWVGIYTRGYLFLGFMLMSVVIMLQTCIQLMASGLPVFIAVVGLHNYLLYFPMLLVFPICLTEKYRRKFIYWNLLFSIPMCLLAVAQAESPKSAWVNRTSEGEAFGLPGADVARVSGTFNFVSFYGIWVGIAVALCMGEWLLPKEKRVIQNKWVLIGCTMAVNICHLVSASRFTILLAGIAIFGALVAALLKRSFGALTAIGGIMFLLPIAATATYLISPAEFNIVLDRFTGSEYVDEGQNRLVNGFIGFATEPKFSLVGAGIGLGVDAAHVGNSDAYNFTYSLSENDLVRNVMELGTLVGMFYVLTRILFIAGIVLIAIQIVRSGSTPHVLPLSFVLAAQSYQGDWTRSAAMSASQVMVGYAFILGAFYHPDEASTEIATSDSLMRSE